MTRKDSPEKLPIKALKKYMSRRGSEVLIKVNGGPWVRVVKGNLLDALEASRAIGVRAVVQTGNGMLPPTIFIHGAF